MVTKAERKKALEDNTKDLAKWLKANKDKKKTGRFVKTIWHGKVKIKPTYIVPRDKLLLNFRNHRFTTEWDNLRQERTKQNKDPEFDPFNDDQGAFRIGSYLNKIVDGYNKSLKKEDILSLAASEYSKKWGEDKINY